MIIKFNLKKTLSYMFKKFKLRYINIYKNLFEFKIIIEKNLSLKRKYNRNLALVPRINPPLVNWT